MGRYSAITGQCFINAPFAQLESGLLEIFLEHGLQPEIGLDGECLWTGKDGDFVRIARRFREKGLACTLHAPFTDLSPGAADREIRKVTRKKLGRAFSLIEVFEPRSIVCHLGYDDNKHSCKIADWLALSLETWGALLEKAAETNTPVMFENTYEQRPDVHLRLFAGLQGGNFGFCLDTGHLTAFAGTSWQMWLDRLQPWLGQVHLHDNNGERDEHLAIGRGKFDFTGLFDHLRGNNLSPLLTLEPHSEEDLWQSLENIRALDLFNSRSR